MRMSACIAVVFLCAMAVPVSADQLIDGKKALICASVESAVCWRGEKCEKALPEDIGAPQFMRIDVSKKEVIGPKRTSPILQMETTDDQFTLQGFELGMGWTIAIDRSTGKTSTTFARMDQAVVVFGACTPYPWDE